MTTTMIISITISLLSFYNDNDNIIMIIVVMIMIITMLMFIVMIMILKTTAVITIIMTITVIMIIIIGIIIMIIMIMRIEYIMITSNEIDQNHNKCVYLHYKIFFSSFHKFISAESSSILFSQSSGTSHFHELHATLSTPELLH